ncbi:hypothetical protein [Micromonospora sp. KC721]|uniref:hypothetical protein n=1 Tax=Micromonospora sp. KC721 TaxID=2530380 RepID=UPI00104CA137|nr:hypothetical protein [Micromonospora sp. KC721]TDB78403.1 hypothetical protein E1182_15725 [Micromonospora sp. KC721]
MARILALALLAAVFGACSGPDESSSPDPATLRGYAEEYVSLLQAKDEPGLRQHLGNEAHPGDAAKRLAAYGGAGWVLSDASWTSLAPRVYALSMVVSGPADRTTWRYNVEWTGERWIMAPLDSPPTGAATARPE